MADEVVEEKAAPTKKPIFIYVAVGLVLVLALAGGTAYYVVTNFMGSGKAAAPREPGVLMKLGDPKEGMIVNVGGVKAGRFLKVGIALEMNPARKENVLDGKIVPAADSKIMDTTLQLLRTVKLEELDASKQEALKTRLRDDLNKVLGDGSVYAVYITSFVLQ